MTQDQSIDLSNTFDNFKPNRKMRRAKVPALKGAVRAPRRYDKVLAKHYGIPKMFRQYAKRHGLGLEYVCSTLHQQGAIKFKELPEDLNHRIYWRRA